MTLGIVLDLPDDLHDDRLRRRGSLTAHAHRDRDLQEAVNDLHALRDFAECGIIAVQEGFVTVADEELARCAVRIGAACHGDDAALMRQIILDTVAAELALDRFLAAAHAGALRVAALCHKVDHDAVEGQPVVKSLIHELLKVLAGDRCDIRIQRDDKRILADLCLADRLQLCICKSGTRIAAAAQSRQQHHGRRTDRSLLQFHLKTSPFGILYRNAVARGFCCITR